MQPTVAFQRIDLSRFDAGPKSNQAIVPGKTTHSFPAIHSGKVEAAAAASTHSGRPESEKESPSHGRDGSHSGNFRGEMSVRTNLDDQLNFEFDGNKNSITAFMIRLRRVYQA
jgi:hypothetical protein